MNDSSSISWMFWGSVIIGFFITSSLLVNSRFHIKNTVTKLYQALFMALWMVLLQMLMMISKGRKVFLPFVLIVLGSTILVGYMARRQIGIGDSQYLKAMIQHHSSAILTSSEILNKSKSIFVRRLANEIIEAQEKEIKEMEDYLDTSQ